MNDYIVSLLIEHTENPENKKLLEEYRKLKSKWEILISSGLMIFCDLIPRRLRRTNFKKAYKELERCKPIPRGLPREEINGAIDKVLRKGWKNGIIEKEV